MSAQNKERGALIVEATIVFPVMFIVIFFILISGNAFLQKCRIENITNKYALQGASYCADPMLDELEEQKIPGYKDTDIRPYRYVLGGMSDVVSDIQKQVNNEVKKMGTGLFTHMKPSDVHVRAGFKNGFIYSNFWVEIQCRICIPIRLLGAKDFIYLDVNTRSDMPVSDTTEFIRTIDLVEDYVERSGLKEKIDEVAEKTTNTFSGMLDKAAAAIGLKK